MSPGNVDGPRLQISEGPTEGKWRVFALPEAPSIIPRISIHIYVR